MVKIINDIMKSRSAAFSNKDVLFSVFARIDMNERQVDRAKVTTQIATISSMRTVCGSFMPLIVVNTRKVKPRRFEEAFRICGDLSFWKILLSIAMYETF
jgi:hypothetical protein